MTDYYELELDDMVIALNNKDIDIEMLQKKLDIARKALQFYADTTTWWCCHKSQCAYVDGVVARQALKEIDEVKTSVKGSFASETLKIMEEVATETIKERRNHE